MSGWNWYQDQMRAVEGLRRATSTLEEKAG